MSTLGNAVLIGALALVPLVLLMMTSFVKVSVVLSLVRNAIGAPDAPSSLVVFGISLILTFFVMAPVAIDMVSAATSVPGGAGLAPPNDPGTRPPAPATGSAAPPASLPAVTAGSAPAPTPPLPAVTAGSASAASTESTTSQRARLDFAGAVRAIVPPEYHPQVAAAERALGPLQVFLAKHSAAADRETFTNLAQRMGRSANGDEVWVLAPAFLSTELREAFAIAVLIFLPFLVVDLVVGLGLAALGLSATSPQTVALPLKLLLFISVDGWRMLLDSLLRGYV